jgi:hypothetical protein
MSLRTLEKAINRTADRTVGDIVATYGSDVKRLKMDAAAGKIDPTTALMAMMTIQRIVAANTQPPSGSTVAQDVGMAPPPQPMGMSAMAPQAPVGMAYGGQVAVSNNQVPSPAMERGISGLPVPDNMFDYADGGMIAFSNGGDTKEKWIASARKVNPTLNYDELSNYYDANIANTPGESLPPPKVSFQGTPLSPRPRAFTSQLPSAQIPLGGGEGAITLPRSSQDSSTRTAGLMALAGAQGQGAYLGRPLDTTSVAQPSRVIGPRPDMPIQPGSIVSSRGDEPFAVNLSSIVPPRAEIKPQDKTKQPSTAKPAATSAPTSAQVRPVVEGMDAQPYAGYMDRAESQVRNLMKLPEVTTAEQEVKRMKAADVAAGVDPEFFQKQSLKLEEAKEALKGDRSEAANLRLLEAGLAIMGGASPFAFVNIGKGASEAMKGFAQDVKDLQKQRKEYDKLQRDLAVAEQTAARTKSAAAYENVERKQSAFDAAKNNMAKATIDLAQSYESVALTKEGLRLKQYLGEKQIEATREQTAASERSRREAEEGRKEYREDQAKARYMGLRRQEISDATKEVDAQLNKLSEFEVMQGGKLNPDQQRMKNNLMARKKLIIQGIDDTYAPLIGDVGGDASGFKLRGTRPAQ